MTIQEKLQNFVNNEAKYVERDGTTKFSTCDHRNWDQDIYNHLGAITTALRERGYDVSIKVNWGVTDVTITKKIELS